MKQGKIFPRKYSHTDRKKTKGEKERETEAETDRQNREMELCNSEIIIKKFVPVFPVLKFMNHPLARLFAYLNPSE